MPKEKILEYLALKGEEDALKLRLVMQIAPLLKGIRCSCILVVASKNLQAIRRELTGTTICCSVLHTQKEREVILLYRKEEMELYLREKKVAEFLASYGYLGDGWKDYQPLLKKRVACFYESNQKLHGSRANQIIQEVFPHEIGAFLGYPIEDVKGFIKNDGKNFLLCGYWKVYSNMQKAKEKFRQIDEAKDKATREYLAGKTVYEIAG